MKINGIDAHAHTKDLTGQVFGDLTVLLFAGYKTKNGIGSARWTVKCLCGVTKDVRSDSLTNQGVKSCGCGRLKSVVKHGKSSHKLYNTWHGMIARCTNPKSPNYYLYGERGITVCEKWAEFDAFLSDMEASWCAGKTLDRVNNNLGYSPENCRWATSEQQQNNMRSNVWIMTPMGEMTMTQAERIFELPPRIISKRIKMGWSVDRLIEPVSLQYQRT